MANKVAHNEPTLVSAVKRRVANTGEKRAPAITFF
jgi:hypothetical protein